MMEERIGEWRSYVRRRQVIDAMDVDELEDHLRAQVADLREAGLDEEEAFLIAVKRLGDLDSLSREYAREYSERLWKRLVVGPEAGESGVGSRKEALVAVGRGEPPSVHPRGIRSGWRRSTCPWRCGWPLASPYAGGLWRDHQLRMNYVRFSGEWFIYYALIALGGGVLMMITMFIFQCHRPGRGVAPQFVGAPVRRHGRRHHRRMTGGVRAERHREYGPGAHAALHAALHSDAPGLPGHHGVDVERDVLIGFDLLLVLVVGLLLYAILARNPQAKPGFFDGLQLLLVISAFLVDALALWAILARISEFGFTPNRVAALGKNLILVVNLGWSAVLCARFLGSQIGFTPLERWQTAYLPVYAVWAWVVVVLFPLVFSFQ